MKNASRAFRFLQLATRCTLLTTVLSALALSATPGPRKHELINENWLFHLGDITPATAPITPDYDDTTPAWRQIKLPHDYGLDAPYKQTSSKRRGYLDPEIGWYRKHLHIPATDAGKTLQLEFGAIFRDAKIWLNGHYLGNHKSGYTTFFIDITRAAKPGADNLLVIRVDPTQREGWWYEGSGIYRNVYYNATSPLHVANYGTYIISTVPNGNQGASDLAEITIETTIDNDAPSPATCEVISEIIAPSGKVVATLKNTHAVNANSTNALTQKTTIQNPKLWSIETPHLYHLRTTLMECGDLSPLLTAGLVTPPPIDTLTTTFGIRTIHFDPDTGFHLNGKHVRIQGAANHIDMPAVGIAVPDSLQPWRVKKLQQMGANAWRMAHNPPSETLLDACDRLGMLVKAENRHLGNSYTDAERPDFDATTFPDLTDMIRRDRNHPSIIMWSLSNEGGNQDTAPGERLWRAMKADAERFDKTRPYTSAMNKGWLAPHTFAKATDILGVNYNTDKYDAIRAAHPGKPLYGSETANMKTTRGVYANDPATGQVSEYNIFEPKNTKFGSPLCTEGWPAITTRPWMAGSFKWTGFDYKGEPNPYGWPAISNNTGFMDVCGFPKDSYYYQKASWTTEPMVHIMPMTWNWPPDKIGKPIRVVLFSNAPQVELLHNNKTLGKKPIPKDGWAEWQVPYAPGTLEARASTTTGQLVATDKLETTGTPATIRLTPDRATLVADNQDTIIVPVTIHDSEGRLVPDAANRITFTLAPVAPSEGRARSPSAPPPARILGTGNGNPSDHDPDRADNRRAFHGHCIVLIQAGKTPATLQLTATSPGLKPATINLNVVPFTGENP